MFKFGNPKLNWSMDTVFIFIPPVITITLFQQQRLVFPCSCECVDNITMNIFAFQHFQIHYIQVSH